MRYVQGTLLTALLLGTGSFNSYAAQNDVEYIRDWRRVQSENFVLIGDASEGSMRRIGRQLEEFRQAALAVMPASHTLASGPTTVVVFRSNAVFRHFRPGDGVAAYFTGGPYKNYIALAAESDTQEIIFHEYVHRLTREYPDWPQWMREGTAEFYSTLDVRRDGEEIRLGYVIIPHLVRLSTTFIPLEEFLDLETRFDDSRTLYAESWAFLHYLMVARPELGAGLGEFVGLLESGRGVEASVEEAFGIDLDSLNDSFVQYLRGSVRFPVADLTLVEPLRDVVIPDAVDLTEPEASSHLGDLLLHIERYDEAKRYLDYAIEVAGEFEPALTSLHFLHERQGEEALADQYLDRALAAPDPGYLPRLLAAQRLLLEGPFSLVADEAEAELRIVVRERENLADGHFWLGQLLMRKPDEVAVAEAVESLARAVELDPLDTRIRLTYAEAVWQSGDDEAALSILGELIEETRDALIIDEAEALEDTIRAVAAIRRTASPPVAVAPR